MSGYNWKGTENPTIYFTWLHFSRLLNRKKTMASQKAKNNKFKEWDVFRRRLHCVRKLNRMFFLLFVWKTNAGNAVLLLQFFSYLLPKLIKYITVSWPYIFYLNNFIGCFLKIYVCQKVCLVREKLKLCGELLVCYLQNVWK